MEFSHEDVPEGSGVDGGGEELRVVFYWGELGLEGEVGSEPLLDVANGL